LKPLTDIEEKDSNYRKLRHYHQENKYLTSKNELINAKVEINRIGAEYAEKVSKANSDNTAAVNLIPMRKLTN
jgi:hypothetical protein